MNLCFNDQEYVTFDNLVCIPLPSGFKTAKEDTDGNENWFYFIPEDVSPYENHMNAKPLSFAISRNYMKCTPFQEGIMPGIETALKKQGLLDSEIKVYDCPCAGRCRILYQCWVDPDDLTYNQITGWLLAYDRLYRIHFYQNHDSNIADQEEVITEFLTMCVNWMCFIRLSIDDFPYADPESSLCKHYKRILDCSNAINDAVVVVNSAGSEYELKQISDMIYDDVDLIDIMQDIVDNDTDNFDLFKKVSIMERVFHVDESIFNPTDDREAEIENGLIKKAYMMSALRSFAWTVHRYCMREDIEIEDLEIDKINEIVDFIKSRQWLNYDVDGSCNGLCGCSDLHVYYINDYISQEYEDKLTEVENVFSFSDFIPCTVSSLDELREDLKEIYPAIKKIYLDIKESRNEYEALNTPSSDILYAWCALTKAARSPFFTEDGPSTYYYDQVLSDFDSYDYDDLSDEDSDNEGPRIYPWAVEKYGIEDPSAEYFSTLKEIENSYASLLVLADNIEDAINYDFGMKLRDMIKVDLTMFLIRIALLPGIEINASEYLLIDVIYNNDNELESTGPGFYYELFDRLTDNVSTDGTECNTVKIFNLIGNHMGNPEFKNTIINFFDVCGSFILKCDNYSDLPEKFKILFIDGMRSV